MSANTPNTSSISSIDQFGRIIASRQDRDRLHKIWRAEHGQPRNSGELIVEDQWIHQQIAEELAK